MCRDIDKSGRRCPCDTSEARRLRRRNATARQGYAKLATQPVEPKTLPPVSSSPASQFTVENVKADIQGLHKLADKFREKFTMRDEIHAAYDKQLNLIGTGVLHLAETKHGAPTDEELIAIRGNTEKAALEKADEAKQAAKQNAAEAKERFKEAETELHTYANNSTHSSEEERVKVWEEQAPELYESYKKLEIESEEADQAIFSTHSNVTGEVDTAVREALKKRNVAMKAALEELGVTFADPETLKCSEDSHKDAVEGLKEALQYYPQLWLHKSNIANRIRELRVKRSSGRAHYSSKRGQKKYDTHIDIDWTEKPENWKPDPLSKDDLELVSLNGANHWVDPNSGMKHHYRSISDQKAWVRISYDYIDQPRKGWEKVTFREEKWDRENKTWIQTDKIVSQYRKPRNTRTLNSVEFKAEITVSKDVVSKVGDNAGFRVAMHEFAHRVEHTHPVIAGYEDAFLRRRAGQLASSAGVEPEEMTSIYKSSDEKGYKDNFVSHYVGKVYSDSNYREILSTGMEGLFAGSYGSLSGLGGSKADPEHKKFVLAALASSVQQIG